MESWKICRCHCVYGVDLCCSAAFPIKDLELVEQRVQATERKRKATRSKMLSTTRAMLKEFHRNLNEKLAQLLDDEQFTWPELSTPDIGGDNESPVGNLLYSCS